MEIFIIILVIVALLIIPNIKIVPQAKSYVIERLGSYYATWGNGLHFKIPFIDSISSLLIILCSFFVSSALGSVPSTQHNFNNLVN